MIEVFANRVEIYNPGGLPSGLDPKKFGTKSVPRNLLIASMLHRANYIEKAGTGIGRIKSALAKHKKKVKLDIQYGDDSMFYSVIFRKTGLVKTTQKTPMKTTQKTPMKTTQKTPMKTTQKTPMKTTQKTPMKTTQKTPMKTTQKILDLIEQHPFVTREDLSRQIGNITSDGVKYHLEQLKKQGALKRTGPDKGGYWTVIKKSSK